MTTLTAVRFPGGAGIRTGRRWNASGAFAAWGAVLAVVYLVLPRLWPGMPSVARAAIPVAVSASVVVAIAAGVLRYAPSPAWPWVLLAVGRLAYTVGDYMTFSHGFSHTPLPFPSFADVLYLGHYPLLIACVVGLMRRSGTRWRDMAALVDASIVAVASGLVMWLFLLRPYAVGPGSALVRMVAMLYVVMDLATFTVTVRLFFGGGSGTTALRLVNVSVGTLLVTDVVYNALLLNGGYHVGGAFDLLWLAAYVALGAAALHPSMAADREVAPAHAGGSYRGRIATLAAAALVGPVLDMVVRGFEVETAIGSIVLSMLVVTRLAGLLRAEAAARTERAALATQVLHAREEERTLLALELHDGPIQRLAGIGLVLDSVDIALDGACSPLQPRVAQARDGVLDEVGVLRRLMAELQPPALDQRGLAGALRDYVQAFGKRCGMEVRLHLVDAVLPVGRDAATALYRVAQEALTNACKHSRAGRIDVRVRQDPAGVHLSIADDGRGFDPSHGRSRLDHLGLVSMRERTERAGGTFRIETGPNGTTVTASVPRLAHVKGEDR
jgi:signal transduction histidine kinase